MNAGVWGARSAPSEGAAAPVPWNDVQASQQRRGGVAKTATVSPASFSLTLDWEPKGSHFFGAERQTPSRVDFGMGSRGDVPARRVGTLRLSPGVPTPDPDPFGHRRGFGGLPPNGRLGRPLCRLPAITTCRGGPLKGPPLNKELYETVGGSGRGSGPA